MISRLFVSGTTRFPRLDISFVVSTTAVDSDGNFKLIKSTMESIIEHYGVKKHLYSMVVFGQNANIILPFQKTTKDSLLSLIKGAQLASGSPDLVNALETTKKLFFQLSGGARPDSRKIVVVMIDKKSVNSGSAIEKIVGEYDDGKVRFVTVVIGNEADPDELIPLTPDKDKKDIVPTDKDDDPRTVEKKIMVAIAKGKNCKFSRFLFSCIKKTPVDKFQNVDSVIYLLNNLGLVIIFTLLLISDLNTANCILHQ